MKNGRTPTVRSSLKERRYSRVPERRRARCSGLSNVPKVRFHRFSIGQRLGRGDIQPNPGSDVADQEAFAALTSSVVPHLVILGDPGGGKTTLLRWLATACLMRRTDVPDLARLPDSASLPKNEWLPVLIRCRDLDKSRIENQQLTIKDVLEQSLNKLEIHAKHVESFGAYFVGCSSEASY